MDISSSEPIALTGRRAFWTTTSRRGSSPYDSVCRPASGQSRVVGCREPPARPAAARQRRGGARGDVGPHGHTVVHVQACLRADEGLPSSPYWQVPGAEVGRADVGSDAGRSASRRGPCRDAARCDDPGGAVVIAAIMTWNRLTSWADLGHLRRHVLPDELRPDSRLSPHVGPPRVRGTAGGEFVLLALGSMAGTGDPVRWAAIHLEHHARSDRDGDPHSPLGTVSSTPTWAGSCRASTTSHEIYARSVLDDPMVLVLPAYVLVLDVAGRRDPVRHRRMDRTALGRRGAALLHPSRGFSVNSICHTFGRADYDTGDRSRNEWVLGRRGAGRGMAQQPPRVPALRLPRAALVAARRLGLPHQGVGGGRSRPRRPPGDPATARIAGDWLAPTPDRPAPRDRTEVGCATPAGCARSLCSYSARRCSSARRWCGPTRIGETLPWPASRSTPALSPPSTAWARSPPSWPFSRRATSPCACRWSSSSVITGGLLLLTLPHLGEFTVEHVPLPLGRGVHDRRDRHRRGVVAAAWTRPAPAGRNPSAALVWRPTRSC